MSFCCSQYGRSHTAFSASEYSDPHYLNFNVMTVNTAIAHLIREGKSHSYVNQALSALRFLHDSAFPDAPDLERIPRPRRKKQLPRVLSPVEVRRFLDGEYGFPSRAPSHDPLPAD